MNCRITLDSLLDILGRPLTEHLADHIDDLETTAGDNQDSRAAVSFSNVNDGFGEGVLRNDEDASSDQQSGSLESSELLFDFTTGAIRGNINAGTRSGVSLDGSAGTDRLDGGNGNDRLSGGSGNDILIDSVGRDDLRGGSGTDTFKLSNDGERDVIRDFNSVEGDVLDLSDFVTLNDGDSIDDILSVTQQGSSSVITAKDTAGNEQEVAVMHNTSGLDVQQLFDDGQIVVDQS